MKQTTNYNLVKPELTDSPPDITVTNPNWDAIDAKLKTNEEQIENLGVQSLVNSGYYSTGTCSSIVRGRLSAGFTTGRFSTSKLSDMPVGGIVVFYSHLAASSGVWCELYGSDGNIYTARINNNDGSYLVQWDLMIDKTQFDVLDANTIQTKGSLSNSDLNVQGNIGIYRIIGGTKNNSAPGDFNGYGILEIKYGSEAGYTVQELLQVNNKNKWIRATDSSRSDVVQGLATWTAWEKIVTDKQPNWISGTLQNGATGTLQYTKNALGIVTLRGYVKLGTLTEGTTIASIPEGYRPSFSKPVLLVRDAARYSNEVFTLTLGGNLRTLTGPTYTASEFYDIYETYYAG